MARRDREKIRGKEISEPTEKKEAVNNSSQKSGSGIIGRIISSNKILLEVTAAGILGLSAVGIYGSYKNSKREAQSNLAPNSGVQSLPVTQRRPRESYVVRVPGDDKVIENGNFPDVKLDGTTQMLHYFSKFGPTVIRIHPEETINQILLEEISEIQKKNPKLLKKIDFNFGRFINYQSLMSAENTLPGPSFNSSVGLTPTRSKLLRNKLVDIEQSLMGVRASALHIKKLSKEETGKEKVFPSLPSSVQGYNQVFNLEHFIFETLNLKEKTKSALLQKNLLLRIIRSRKMHEKAHVIIKEIMSGWNSDVPKVSASFSLENGREVINASPEVKPQHQGKYLVNVVKIFKTNDKGEKKLIRFLLKSLHLTDLDKYPTRSVYEQNLGLSDKSISRELTPLYTFDSLKEANLAISLLSAKFLYGGLESK